MSENEAGLLRALRDEHSGPLWRYIVHLTGDRDLADDVVQETLLRAWRRPSVLDQSQSSARAWLFTVARNLVIDDRRSAHHRHELTVEELPDQVEADRIDALLESWVVTEALSGLSLEHRAVLVHVYYGGGSIAETSEKLGIPPGTVKSRLHYGLRALRLALQERGVTG